jgi:hypothetical protein
MKPFGYKIFGVNFFLKRMTEKKTFLMCSDKVKRNAPLKSGAFTMFNAF